MKKKNELLLQIFKSEEVKREDTPTEVIMRKFVKDWIAKSGSVLQKGNEEDDKKHLKAVKRHDILRGKAAKVIFDTKLEAAFKEFAIKAKLNAEIGIERQLKTIALEELAILTTKLSRKGERDRGFSKKEIAFCDWVKKYNIDLNESLDSIHDKLEQAYIAKQISENVSRSKLAEFLAKYRPKKD